MTEEPGAGRNDPAAFDPGATPAPAGGTGLSMPEDPGAAPEGGPDPAEVRELAAFRAAVAASTPRIVITPALLAANLLVFAAMAVAGVGVLEPSGKGLIDWGANFGPQTLSGQWWRLLSSVFVHIGLLHLTVNMWALWNIGRLVEKLLGNCGYAALYLLAGLAGSLASLAWNPEVISAGASGALFGLFGGLVAFLARHRRSIPRAVLLPLARNIAACALINVTFGLTVQGIDNAAHFGGLGCGFLAGLALARPLGPEAFRRGLLRAAGVFVAGALALTAGAAALPRGVVEAWRAPEVYARDEAAAVEAYNSLIPSVKSGELSEAQWADRLESEVLPLYRRAAGQLPAPDGLPPATRERIDRLRRYARLRVEWMELLVRAGRTGSEADRRAAEARSLEVQALLEPDGGGRRSRR